MNSVVNVITKQLNMVYLTKVLYAINLIPVIIVID